MHGHAFLWLIEEAIDHSIYRLWFLLLLLQEVINSLHTVSTVHNVIRNSIHGVA